MKIKEEKIEELCEANVLATIPFEKNIQKSIFEMKPLVMLKPNSKVSGIFNELATKIIEKLILRKVSFKNYLNFFI
jgi:MinD-like ATPase involved in chromosome partitioning or flagellar assembly